MVQAKIHIWDTGGQEQFRSMLSMYYRDAAGALICFDLTNPKSFSSVNYWIEEMEKNNNSDKGNFVLAMAGNKCDLDSQKMISYAEANELALEKNLIYQETSAKSGEGVQEVFMEMIKQIIIKKREQQ